MTYTKFVKNNLQSYIYYFINLSLPILLIDQQYLFYESRSLILPIDSFHSVPKIIDQFL